MDCGRRGEHVTKPVCCLVQYYRQEMMAAYTRVEAGEMQEADTCQIYFGDRDGRSC